MIEVKQLNKQFGRLKVLKGITLSLERGKSYALVGPNGSGKTTLIKAILGMVVPDSGMIEVDGISTRANWEYRRHIGYMPQIGRYPDNMTIGQLITMIRDLRAAHSTTDEDLVKEFKLHTMLNKRMHTLSGGTRQKVSAALAFMFNPPVYVLDEPTAGLDPVAVEVMKEKIRMQMSDQKLFLITSHILSDLDELSGEVICLDEGTLIYNNAISRLKQETGEQKLGKAIASMILNKGISVNA